MANFATHTLLIFRMVANRHKAGGQRTPPMVYTRTRSCYTRLSVTKLRTTKRCRHVTIDKVRPYVLTGAWPSPCLQCICAPMGYAYVRIVHAVRGCIHELSGLGPHIAAIAALGTGTARVLARTSIMACGSLNHLPISSSSISFGAPFFWKDPTTIMPPGTAITPVMPRTCLVFGKGCHVPRGSPARSSKHSPCFRSPCAFAPTTATRPLGSTHAAGQERGDLIGEISVQAPVIGSHSSADDVVEVVRRPVSPPTTSTLPSARIADAKPCRAVRSGASCTHSCPSADRAITADSACLRSDDHPPITIVRPSWRGTASAPQPPHPSSGRSGSRDHERLPGAQRSAIR